MLERTRQDIDRELEKVAYEHHVWEELTAIVNLGVSKASLAEELGIDRANVSTACSGKGKISVKHHYKVVELLSEVSEYAERRLQEVTQEETVRLELEQDKHRETRKRLWEEGDKESAPEEDDPIPVLKDGHSYKELIGRINYAKNILRRRDQVHYRELLWVRLEEMGLGDIIATKYSFQVRWDDVLSGQSESTFMVVKRRRVMTNDGPVMRALNSFVDQKKPPILSLEPGEMGTVINLSEVVKHANQRLKKEKQKTNQKGPGE